MFRNLVGSGGRRNKVCEDPADLPEAHLRGGLLHDLVVGIRENPQGVLAALLRRLVDGAHHGLDAQGHIGVLLIPDVLGLLVSLSVVHDVRVSRVQKNMS